MSSSGLISGTPVERATSVTFTVRATGQTAPSADRSFNLKILPGGRRMNESAQFVPITMIKRYDSSTQSWVDVEKLSRYDGSTWPGQTF